MQCENHVTYFGHNRFLFRSFYVTSFSPIFPIALGAFFVISLIFGSISPIFMKSTKKVVQKWYRSKKSKNLDTERVLA